MALKSQRERQERHHSIFWRLILAIIALLLLSSGAIIWILNIQDIIRGPWSSVLAVLFALLGLIIALFQWLFPFSPNEPNRAEILPVNISKKAFPPQISNKFLPPKLHEPPSDSTHPDIESIAVALGVNKDKGAIVVYRTDLLRGISIVVCNNCSDPAKYWSSTADKHTINKQTIYAAFFRSLEPGDYVAYDELYDHMERLTVMPQRIAELDWRS